jgi:hypothetical protein
LLLLPPVTLIGAIHGRPGFWLKRFDCRALIWPA